MSCSQELDFNQVDDFSASPVLEVSVIDFTLLPVQFFNEMGQQDSTRTQTTDFLIFENNFVRNNIVRIEFNAEIINEIDKEFILELAFLDGNDNITHAFTPIEVPANTLITNFMETVNVQDNPIIKNTQRFRFSARFKNPNPPLRPSDPNRFILKSSAKIYIEVNG